MFFMFFMIHILFYLSPYDLILTRLFPTTRAGLVFFFREPSSNALHVVFMRTGKLYLSCFLRDTIEADRTAHLNYLVRVKMS